MMKNIILCSSKLVKLLSAQPGAISSHAYNAVCYKLLTYLRYNQLSLRSISTSKYSFQEEKSVPSPAANFVEIIFIKANGEKIKSSGKEGDSLLDVIVNNNLDFDGYGACEGTLTCSTCHVILEKEDYDKLPEKPSDEELDMLDLAYELTDTSRLGCQIILTQELNGLEVKLPSTLNDARAADN